MIACLGVAAKTLIIRLNSVWKFSEHYFSPAETWDNLQVLEITLRDDTGIFLSSRFDLNLLAVVKVSIVHRNASNLGLDGLEAVKQLIQVGR